MNNKNNWRRVPQHECACGCGAMVAKSYKKGHGRRRPIAERLAEKVQASDGCLEWTGAVSPGGYGRIGVGGYRTEQVHRIAYALALGPIPEGLHIDHLCNNRRCVNPEHLEAVTQAENNRRMGERRRVALLTGERKDEP